MHVFVELVWLVPLLPLVGFVLAFFFGRRVFREQTPMVTLGCLGLSVVLAWMELGTVVWGHFISGEPTDLNVTFRWFTIGDRDLMVGYLLDPLAAAMIAMVTLVAWLIMRYSIGYLHGDPLFSRFFAYLSLFTFAMLLLVVANNFLFLFIGWELVGLCSYLLIGFWFDRRYKNPDLPQPAPSAKKAFVVTKFGDLGFFLGLMAIFAKTHSFLYDDVFAAAPHWGRLAGAAIPLLLFCGAIGKSAQFPLHVWLPDAMAGPTPVSALIHAATMVAAGVYLVARTYPLFYHAPSLDVTLGGFLFTLDPLHVVAWIGGITALMAATIAVLQWDIKKILAYSTISQLGYMMLALGCGGYTAAVFHLLTHAFFKALLFLGSGSVIHACGLDENGEPIQDIRQMGGLGRAMPKTTITFWIGTCALAGIFPLAGFWSKDEILLEVGFHWGHQQPTLFVFGLTAAFLTAFYMARLCYLTFSGDHPRNHAIHPHESPETMTTSLWVLAGFSAVLGLLGTPWGNVFHHFIHYTPPAAFGEVELHGAEPRWWLMGASLVIAALGIFVGYVFYHPRPVRELGMATVRRVLGLVGFPLYWLIKNKYWWDEIWWGLLVVPMFAVMRALRWIDTWVVDGIVNAVGWLTAWMATRIWRWIDDHLVDGTVNGVARVTGWLGGKGRRLQTGQLQGYAVLFLFLLLVIVVVQILTLRV